MNMQPAKYRRRKHHPSLIERDRLRAQRWREKNDEEIARMKREAPWWERLLCWILRW